MTYIEGPRCHLNSLCEHSIHYGHNKMDPQHTVCQRPSGPLYVVIYYKYYKMGHFFLDIQYDLYYSGSEGSPALYSVREITTSSGTSNHLEPVYTNNKAAAVQVYPAPADAHAYTMESGYYMFTKSHFIYKIGFHGYTVVKVNVFLICIYSWIYILHFDLFQLTAVGGAIFFYCL